MLKVFELFFVGKLFGTFGIGLDKVCKVFENLGSLHNCHCVCVRVRWFVRSVLLGISTLTVVEPKVLGTNPAARVFVVAAFCCRSLRDWFCNQPLVFALVVIARLRDVFPNASPNKDYDNDGIQKMELH